MGRIKSSPSSERGDTLIEVVFALGILTAVITSSMALAVNAYNTGQTALERTRLADEAQQQIEVLRAFRDNHTWNEFLYGGASGAYPGVLSFAGSTFHLEKGNSGPGQTEYLPRAGVLGGSVPTSLMEIAVTAPPGAGAPPTVLDFTLSYGFTKVGGVTTNTGHIKTRLANIRQPAP